MSIEKFPTPNKETHNNFEAQEQKENHDESLKLCKNLKEDLFVISQNLPEHLFPELTQKFEETLANIYEHVNSAKDVGALVRPLLHAITEVHKTKFDSKTEEQILFNAKLALAEILDKHSKLM